MSEHEGHEHGSDVLAGLRKPGMALRRLIPEVYEGYSALAKASLADGAVPVKYKELIALAISVTKQCDGCIASHARAAARAGCTDVEVAEAIGVAIMMNGGPGTVYGPRALAAFNEFKASEKPASE